MKQDKLELRVLFDHLGTRPSIVARSLVKSGTTQASQRTIEKSILQGLNPKINRHPTQIIKDFLDEARERQIQEIEAIVAKAIESRNKKGITAVRLPYYTSQEDYDTLYDDGYDWHMANATLRLAGAKLQGLGFTVLFVLIDELVT